jgi:hypothetical protein
MAKSAKTISIDINELMRKNGNEAITIKWSQFYEICDRDRLADVIMDKISEELKKNDLHIIYGNNNVIVVRDFCWKPISI